MTSSDFGWHPYPSFEKLQRSTRGMMTALLAGSCPPAKSPLSAKFKFACEIGEMPLFASSEVQLPELLHPWVSMPAKI